MGDSKISFAWFKSKQLLVAVTGFVLLALLFPLLFLLNDSFGTSGVRVVEQGIEAEASDFFDSQTVALYLQMTEFDPETKRAKIDHFPWPTDDLGRQFSSSVVGDVGIRLFIDSQDTQQQSFAAGSQIGAVTATIDVLSTRMPELASDSFYPFDVYELDGYAKVEVEPLEGMGFAPVQTFDYFYTTPLPGFDIEYQRIGAFDQTVGSDGFVLDPAKIYEQRASGEISYLAKIERSFAVKAIAVFIYLFAVVVALSLVLVTLRILTGHRKASISTLVWAATSVIGITTLRNLAPGRPRIGILADNLVFFPSLAVVLGATIAITLLWSTRDYVVER